MILDLSFSVPFLSGKTLNKFNWTPTIPDKWVNLDLDLNLSLQNETKSFTMNNIYYKCFVFHENNVFT